MSTCELKPVMKFPNISLHAISRRYWTLFSDPVLLTDWSLKSFLISGLLITYFSLTFSVNACKSREPSIVKSDASHLPFQLKWISPSASHSVGTSMSTRSQWESQLFPNRSPILASSYNSPMRATISEALTLPVSLMTFSDLTGLVSW